MNPGREMKSLFAFCYHMNRFSFQMSSAALRFDVSTENKKSQKNVLTGKNIVFVIFYKILSSSFYPSCCQVLSNSGD